MKHLDGKIGWEKTALIVLTTLLVVVVAVNFKKPEKRIAYAVRHLNGIHDPVFQREMGVLMGPAILDGNRITALQNGDEIFPAMVAIVTGGDSGIGRAVAVLFAREGADVAVLYLDEHEDAEATKRHASCGVHHGAHAFHSAHGDRRP